LSVTPICSSLAEIESEIQDLQEELDGILREARRTFATSRAPAVDG
jgi:hypothetical protein